MSTKSFWNGSKIGLVTGILIGGLLAGGIVYAYTSTSLPGNMQVVPATGTGSIGNNTSIRVYSDSLCSNAITRLDWGAIAQGQQVWKSIYVKNCGINTISVQGTVSTSTNPDISHIPTAVYGMGGGNPSTKTLSPNSVAELRFYLQPSSGTPVGTYYTLITLTIPAESP